MRLISWVLDLFSISKELLGTACPRFLKRVERTTTKRTALIRIELRSSELHDRTRLSGCIGEGEDSVQTGRDAGEMCRNASWGRATAITMPSMVDRPH